ncbi:hypothetical protein HID58_048309 [Brassica napus]|uniref:Uncharacterized protein n=2 Tax=Brassica TaxID=3705 RepID=A0ABQ8B1R0_BRANA|nr:hypothetical protein HID58_048309 [Brassica napus]
MTGRYLSPSHKDKMQTPTCAKKNRIHYSGPLMPPCGNMEDVLKEYERQIQEAVRKSRLEKSATKKNHRTCA